MDTQEKTIHIQYFALLREQRGQDEETVSTQSPTAAEFYEELREKHNFQLSLDSLKVSINDEFSPWQTELKDGDRVVFIPPVAGG